MLLYLEEGHFDCCATAGIKSQQVIEAIVGIE